MQIPSTANRLKAMLIYNLEILKLIEHNILYNAYYHDI